MKLIFAVVLVAFASTTVAQQEYKCTTPKVWYSHFMEFNPARQQERRGSFYYDEDNKRVAIREERRTGPGNNVTYVHEIFLHNEGVGYRLDNSTRPPMCSTFRLQEPFPIIGPYLSDEYDGEYYIGSAAQEKDGVLTVVYSGTIPERGTFYGVWIPVDEDTCIPVSESFTRVSETSANVRSYYDVRLGIYDPNVFNKPEECM